MNLVYGGSYYSLNREREREKVGEERERDTRIYYNEIVGIT